MKNTTNILAVLLIWLFSINNVSANWFPDEPITIYGNITWKNIENKNLKISDSNNKLLKQVKITWSKYGTSKTLDINNKISLNPYIWNLKFQIDWYNFTSLSKWETNSCSEEPKFQKWNICEYNLSFKEISRSTGWGRSHHRKKKKIEVIDESIKWPISDIKEIEATIISDKIKRNSKWKIIIKWTDYIKTLRLFNNDSKETKKIFWYKVLNIKWHKSYNIGITNYSKKIYNEIKLDWIRKSMFKYMDNITTTYWILINKNLDESLKETFKEKLKEDKETFERKMKTLKRKDQIIRYVLEKRKKH